MALEALVGLSLEGSDVRLYQRKEGTVTETIEAFHPFALAMSTAVPTLRRELGDKIHRVETLTADPKANPFALDRVVFFNTQEEAKGAYDTLVAQNKRVVGKTAVETFSAPVQYFLHSGNAMYTGMEFEDLVRMQVTVNAGPQGGLKAIKVRVNGKEHECKGSTKRILDRFERIVLQEDPDVIETYDIERTFSVINAQARRIGKSLNIGRNSERAWYQERKRVSGKFHPRRHNARFHVRGREVINLTNAVHAWGKETSNTRIKSQGAVIAHFGIQEPEEVAQLDALGGLLLPASFEAAKISAVRWGRGYCMGKGNFSNHVLIGRSLRAGVAIPQRSFIDEPEPPRTKIYKTGVCRNVYKIDVKSMYPSIVKAYDLKPKKDTNGFYREFLDELNEHRVRVKTKRDEFTKGTSAHTRADLEQLMFKLLANTLVGYLGSGYYHWNDIEMARQVVKTGAELITRVEQHLEKIPEVTLVELDTDGIYFEYEGRKEEVEAITRDINDMLPEGIDVSLEGPWSAYFNAIKSYALLDEETGDCQVKGGGLRNVELEKFIVDFLKRAIELVLREDYDTLAGEYKALKRRIESGDIEAEEVGIQKLCRYNRDEYRKRRRTARHKEPHMEVMWRKRDQGNNLMYRQGDTITYFVGGTSPRVRASGNAICITEFKESKATQPNAAYYVRKLEEKMAKVFKFLPKRTYQRMFIKRGEQWRLF